MPLQPPDDQVEATLLTDMQLSKEEDCDHTGAHNSSPYMVIPG